MLATHWYRPSENLPTCYWEVLRGCFPWGHEQVGHTQLSNGMSHFPSSFLPSPSTGSYCSCCQVALPAHTGSHCSWVTAKGPSASLLLLLGATSEHTVPASESPPPSITESSLSVSFSQILEYILHRRLLLAPPTGFPDILRTHQTSNIYRANG